MVIKLNKLNYFKLEIKRNLKLIPYLIIGVLALSIVMGIVGFFATKLSETNKLKDKKNVYFTSEDDASLTKLAINALSKTESITKIFNVNNIKYSEVDEVKDAENSIVTVVVPEGFLASLMNGDNYPIKIYFSSTTSVYTMIITELSLAAQTSLQAAQATVYTLYDDYYDMNKYRFAENANDELNSTLIKKAFSRDNFFKKEQLSASGDYNIITYYIASGILTVLLLSGCIFILRIKSTKNFINLKLNQYGIGAITQTSVRIFSIFITMYLIFSVILTTALFILYKMDKIKDFSPAPLLINGIFICLCCSAITVLISSLMKNRFSSILLLFIFVIGCEFISGAFLPSVFLPDGVNIVDKYLPTGYLLDSLRLGLSGSYSVDNVKMIAIYTLIFTISTIVTTHFKLKIYERIN